MKTNRLLPRLLLPFVALCAPLGAATQEIWVSPSGKDDNAGTKASPVATIERATDLVRAARAAKPADAVTVWLAPGEYPQTQSILFGAADSGTAAAPVVWRGVNRDTVRIIGAKPVAPDRFKAVEDPALLERMDPAARGKIVEMDLTAEGIEHAKELPDYVRDAADLCILFFNGKRLPLSRWPNGEYGYTTMARVISSGNFKANRPDGGVFEYREDRPARWQTALNDGGVWIRGFWRVPWVAETIRVKSIDPAQKTITLNVSISNGIGSKYSKLVDGTRVGDGKENWYALNLLEEIDQPGEWAIDFKRQRLYLWPPAPLTPGALVIADHNAPLLRFEGASHVTLRDVSIGLQLGDAITINDGEAVQIAGCHIEGVAKKGIVIRGGKNHRVLSCDISEIGLTSIDVLGGDRPTLTPSGHQIVNNHIFRVALGAPVPALTAGLDIKNQQLVGARIANNRIHDASYGGITFAGNDNVLELNEIYRIGLDGGDLGGFYNTGGWTTRGNVVRGNLIHHSENANAVYMDDGASGVLVESNIMYRTESGGFIGGGHDNIIRGNLMVECERAIHVDDRGIARKYVATDPRLRGDLNSVPFLESPWKDRFPALTRILETDPAIPAGNVIADNAAVACPAFARQSGKAESLTGFTFENNNEFPNLDVLVDPAALNFQAKDPAATPEIAALKVPKLAQIGLQLDAYRKTLPERNWDLLRTGDTKRKSFDSQQDVEAYPR